MRLNKALVAGMVALVLAACNKTNNNEVDPVLEKGGAYASLTIQRAELRTLTEADENGRNAESEVKNMKLLSAGAPKDFTTTADPKFTTTTSGGAQFYKTDPFETEVGIQTFALVLNPGDVTLPQLAGLAFGFVSENGEKPSKFADDTKGFVMTSVAKKFDVKKIDETTVKNLTAPDETKNGFQLDVERVVAQGIIVNGTGKTGTVATSDKLGDLSGLKYGGAMGAARTFVFADNAGDRKMGTNKMYKGFKSFVDGIVTKKTSKEDELTADATARANFQLAEETNLELATEASPYEKAGYYFFENSSKNPNDQANLGAHRNAYGKVYGVYKPKTIYTATWEFVADDTTGKWFDITDPAHPVGATQDPANDKIKQGKVVGKRVEATVNADGTFFKGEEDGLFYVSSEAAKVFNNQKSYMYDKGRCVYRTPWNRVLDNGKTVYADTRRNNIYVITIKAFEKVGYNYDPNDPKDPNIPKPNNPDEPVTPPDGGDPSWEKDKGYVSFFSKVLPWNKVSREETLGK